MASLCRKRLGLYSIHENPLVGRRAGRERKHHIAAIIRVHPAHFIGTGADQIARHFFGIDMPRCLFKARRGNAMAAKFDARSLAILGQIERPAIVTVSGEDNQI